MNDMVWFIRFDQDSYRLTNPDDKAELWPLVMEVVQTDCLAHLPHAWFAEDWCEAAVNDLANPAKRHHRFPDGLMIWLERMAPDGTRYADDQPTGEIK